MADKAAVKVDQDDKAILINGQIEINDLITNNCSRSDRVNIFRPTYSYKIK
jgi:hypothetical protein